MEKETLLGARRRASPCRCGTGEHFPSNSIKSSAQQHVSLLLLRFVVERAMGEGVVMVLLRGEGKSWPKPPCCSTTPARAVNYSCNEGLGGRQNSNVDEPSTKIIMQGRTLRSSRLGLFQGHLSPCGDAAAGSCIEPRRGTRRATGLWEIHGCSGGSQHSHKSRSKHMGSGTRRMSVCILHRGGTRRATGLRELL